MSKPKVIVTIEGGLVTSVLSDNDLDVVVIDYDTDGVEENELVDILQNDSTKSQAYVYEGEVFEKNEERVHQIIGSII